MSNRTISYKTLSLIADWLFENPRSKTKEIASAVGVAETTVRMALRKLHEIGLLDKATQHGPYTLIAKPIPKKWRWQSKNGFVTWTENGHAYLSVVFSWKLPLAYQQAIFYRGQGFTVHAGGPAVTYNPDYLADVATCNGDMPDTIVRHHPRATFTSKGCIRKCKFCLVPQTEGDLQELDDWPVRPVVCDNNFLACSRAHFNRVVDRLKPLQGVDFHQGLDARLLTDYHASRLAELDMLYLRLAWDNTNDEKHFMSAFEILTRAGFRPELMRIYVLVGFKDTPEDAVYRLQKITDLGAFPFVMRYQPLDASQKDQFLGDNWTEHELTRIRKYFHGFKFYGHIPFESFDPEQHKQKKVPESQMSLF